MSSTRQKLARNAAKVEFKLIRDDVLSMLDDGFNLRNVHAKMLEKRNIAMSYFTLCYYVRKIQEERQAGQQSFVPAKPAAPTPQRQTGIIKSGPTPFPDPKNIDPKTLI